MMEIGKLRHRIALWDKVKFKNELLETDYKNECIKTIWAEVIPQTGSVQRATADTILTNCTHKIKIRYDAGKDIKPDMWFIFRGSRFDIRYILNPYFKNEWLEIFVEEIMT